MNTINYIIDSLLILYSLYYLSFVILGLIDKKVVGENKLKKVAPENEFAVVIPAHNEERVISELLMNLKDLGYPSSLYDVFVIADNCKDDTAKVAGRHDVTVMERTNQDRTGKGYALKYGFERIGLLDGSSDYDAVIIFDADNLMEKNFLREMNSRLENGERIIQAYVDSKNPVDNWVTATFSMMFWINDRYTLLSRYNVGLSAVLMGTGMCISSETLRKTGWDTNTLTEDLEYSIQALFEGIKTTFTKGTKVYDEKPVSFLASCKQRLRWARGQLTVLVQYVPRLLYRSLRERNPVKLDAGLRLFQMPFIMFYFFVTLLRWTLPGLFTGPIFNYVMSNVEVFGVLLPLMPFIIPSSLFLRDRLPGTAFKYVLLFPVFMYSWIALLYWAIFTLDNDQWLHTSHFRNLSRKDLVAKDLITSVNTQSVKETREKNLTPPQPMKVPI
ncbi:MAG: glycosyltransferase family 2 protein [Candidatus Bipolaricaulia bacterium]